LVEARNQGEALIHATEKTLSEAGDKVDDAEKGAITTAIEELKSALASEDVDGIRGKSEALAQASMKLGEAMYAASQAEAEEGPEAAAGAGETPAASEDDKVVDADFEEVDDDRRDKTA
jgi:molecular chaperone DnaK